MGNLLGGRPWMPLQRASVPPINFPPHFHSLVFDGVYPGPTHAPGSFVPLPPPDTDDVARVMAGTARRVMRLLEKRGLEDGEDPLASDDSLLASLMAASIRSRIATGPEAGQPWLRLGDRVELAEEGQGEETSAFATPPRCVREGGMSLHADVSVPARDRARLERLCRYVARPPLALDRLEEQTNGLLSYRLKTRWRDGTTHVLMERCELLERLAPLIPPPRAHQVRYHGLLAPCASGRDRIVPGAVPVAIGVRVGKASGVQPMQKGQMLVGGMEVEGREGLLLDGKQVASASATMLSEPCGRDASVRGRAGPFGHASAIDETSLATESKHLSKSQSPRPSARRLRWAELLRRVFEVDALRCPVCAGKMRVLAAITQPAIAKRILKCLALPARAPPLAAAIPLAEPNIEIAAAGEYDLSVGVEEVPELECDFDQTVSGDWDLSPPLTDEPAGMYEEPE